MWLLCLLVIFVCEEGLVDTFAVMQMDEVWKITSVQFSYITTIGLIAAIIVNFFVGWAGDKFGRWNMMIAVCAINTLVGILLIIGQNNMIIIYIIGLVIAKSLQMSSILLANSMVPTLLNGREVGPIIGLITLGSGIGQYIGPQILGILRDMTKDYTTGWIYMIFIGLVSLIIATNFKFYYNREAKVSV
jgi:MFS family permease